MIIIKTKYLNPTNNRGGRIKAYANGFTATISSNSQLRYEKLHFEAVKKLVADNDLDWDLSNMGYGSDDDGYYFTFSNSVMES